MTNKRDDDALARLLGRRKEAFANARAGRRWYSISNQTGDVAHVRIYDEIGFWGVTADEFVQEINAIAAPEMVVAISSPGGDVFDGIAIYNALRAHPARVTTRIDSLAASAASVVAQAGDHRVMLGGSQLMIHDAWGLVVGNAAEMREMAEILDRQSDVLAGIYASRSGRDAEIFRGLMRAETWMTPEEAVQHGLADEISDPKPKDALARRTLNDELREAMDVVSNTLESAGRVAALRAEEGKRLSAVNRDGLDGLARALADLRALLDAGEASEVADDVSTETDVTAEMEQEFARFVSLTV